MPSNEFILYAVLLFSGLSALFQFFIKDKDSDSESKKKLKSFLNRIAGVMMILAFFLAFLIQFNEIEDDKKTTNKLNSIESKVTKKGEETFDKLVALEGSIDGLNDYLDEIQKVIGSSQIDLDKLNSLKRQVNLYNKNFETNLELRKPDLTIEHPDFNWISTVDQDGDTLNSIKIKVFNKKELSAVDLIISSFLIVKGGPKTITKNSEFVVRKHEYYKHYIEKGSTPITVPGNNELEVPFFILTNKEFEKFNQGTFKLKLKWKDPLNGKMETKQFYISFIKTDNDSLPYKFFSTDQYEIRTFNRFLENNQFEF